MDETQPVRLRMLGAALRRYRLERGFSLDAVGMSYIPS